MATFTVFVPAGDNHFGAAAGSAIVSRPIFEYADEGSRVVVYLEGDIYNRGMTFEEKLLHAADRCNQHYPTVAVRAVPLTDLRSVGTYDLSDHSLHLYDQASLDAWLVKEDASTQ